MSLLTLGRALAFWNGHQRFSSYNVKLITNIWILVNVTWFYLLSAIRRTSVRVLCGA